MKSQGKVWIIYDAENKSQSKPLSVVQTQVVLLSIQPHNFVRYFLWTPGWDEWMSLKDFLAADQTYFVLAHPPKPSDEVTQAIATDKNADKSAEKTQSGIHNSFSQDTSPFTYVEDAKQPVEKDKPNYGYYATDFHGSDLDLSKIRKMKPEPRKKRSPTPPSNSGSIERRKEERHAFKIEVVLVSKVRSFRTHSRNISVSGTMLDKEIPNEFLKKPFDLIIVNPFEPDAAKSRLLFRAKIVGDLSDPRRLMFLEQDPEMTARLEALLKAYVAYQAQIKKTAV